MTLPSRGQLAHPHHETLGSACRASVRVALWESTQNNSRGTEPRLLPSSPCPSRLSRRPWCSGLRQASKTTLEQRQVRPAGTLWGSPRSSHGGQYPSLSLAGPHSTWGAPATSQPGPKAKWPPSPRFSVPHGQDPPPSCESLSLAPELLVTKQEANTWLQRV